MHPVVRHTNIINQNIRSTISQRRKRIAKAVNQAFWGSNDEETHSLYVGSYGRGTAISTSDLDTLIILPEDQFNRFDHYKWNGQSKLIQSLKNTIQTTYPRTDIRGDGQVVVLQFNDEMRFELLPAFEHTDIRGNKTFIYPDSHFGGAWKATNPEAERVAMKEKNSVSNGLLFDTCKHIRTIRDEHFKSYHLPGIVIDSFVYSAINGWQWAADDSTAISAPGEYENHLLEAFHEKFPMGTFPMPLSAPGSGQQVDTDADIISCLHKILTRMAQ